MSVKENIKQALKKLALKPPFVYWENIKRRNLVNAMKIAWKKYLKGNSKVKLQIGSMRN